MLRYTDELYEVTWIWCENTVLCNCLHELRAYNENILVHRHREEEDTGANFRIKMVSIDCRPEPEVAEEVQRSHKTSGVER